MNCLPGGRSITVSRPVRLVRPDVDGAGECDNDCSVELSFGLADDDRSSVHPTVWRFEHPRPCMYLK